MHNHIRRLEQRSNDVEPVSKRKHKSRALKAIKNDDYETAFVHLVHAYDWDIPADECVYCGKIDEFDDTGECQCGVRRNRLHEKQQYHWGYDWGEGFW